MQLTENKTVIIKKKKLHLGQKAAEVLKRAQRVG